MTASISAFLAATAAKRPPCEVVAPGFATGAARPLDVAAVAARTSSARSCMVLPGVSP